MQNIDTGEYRYLHGDKNTDVLENMFQLSTAEDVKRFKEKIKELDKIEQVTVIRPNTNCAIWSRAIFIPQAFTRPL